MSIKAEILTLIEQSAQHLALPPIRAIYMPEPAPAPDKDAEFGMVMLEDGSAGLYYAWLGASQTGMNKRFSLPHLIGHPAAEIAEYYRDTPEDKCSLGLATINAITRHVYKHCGYIPPAAVGSFGVNDVTPADHIGMVGYFPTLVQRLQGQNIRLTVIERKPQFVTRDGQMEVTLDPSRLSACNKVLVTATTLLNDTLDTLLRYATRAESITVLGPTAGFFPDPLFRRGVTAIGGTEITDAIAAMQRLRGNKSLGDAARKYLITRDSYPGFRKLLESA